MNARTTQLSRTVGFYLALALFCLASWSAPARGQVVLVEAEGFEDYGGWSLDTQFFNIVGSNYLLAHGGAAS